MTKEADMTSTETAEDRNDIIASLSAEEKRLLKMHEASRPASTTKKKVVKKKKKGKGKLKRILTAPESYAALFAIIPLFIVIFGVGGLFAVQQISDLDEVLDLDAQEAAEYGIIDSSQAVWYETGVWIYDNAILVIVGSCAVFFVLAMMILVAAKIWRSARTRTDNSTAKGVVGET